MHHAQTTGGFVAFLYALIKTYEPIKRLTGVHNAAAQAVGASEQVFHYLDLHPDIHDEPGATTLPPFESHIEFQNVDFDYEESLPLLRNIDLRIRKGEVVAIVGSSGAGKTTMASLIPRFFDVTRGRLLIDGHDVRHLKLDSLRAQIGIVTQETILFNDTVYNNICYGSQLASEEAAREAARAALAEDFILEMPEGYQTVIGERGQRLSGGSASGLPLRARFSRIHPFLSWMRPPRNSIRNRKCWFREPWPT